VSNRRYIAPREPSEENRAIVERNSARLRPLVRGILRPWQPIEVVGRENVPREGRLLVVANHVAMLDPINVILAADRPIHWMAAETMFYMPFFGRVLRLSGAVPKKKQVKDSRSVRQLKRWADLDVAVGLFPEGERSWDGRPLPILPGIESLVRLMDAPVVTARIINGYQHWPRWAVRPRLGRIRIEFDPPRRFEKREDPEAVRAYIESRIRIPEADSFFPLRGFQTALGASNTLWACPACARIDALQERGSRLVCAACARTWSLSADNWLVDAKGTRETRLAEAIATVRERYAQRPWAEDAASPPDTLLASERGALVRLDGDQMTDVGEGRLELTPERLRFVDGGAPLLDLAHAEITSVTVDVQRELVIRTEELAFVVHLPRESVVKWPWFFDAWRGRAR
jgi:1-acyl-sn-glycerol-3-phosphate acyltransferase